MTRFSAIWALEDVFCIAATTDLRVCAAVDVWYVGPGNLEDFDRFRAIV